MLARFSGAFVALSCAGCKTTTYVHKWHAAFDWMVQAFARQHSGCNHP